MIAYFHALAAEDMPSVALAWFGMSEQQRGLVALCYGGIGREQFGFRAEAGRA